MGIRGQIRHTQKKTAEVSGLDGWCQVPWSDTLDKSTFIWKRSEHLSKGQVEMKKLQILA